MRRTITASFSERPLYGSIRLNMRSNATNVVNEVPAHHSFAIESDAIPLPKCPQAISRRQRLRCIRLELLRLWLADLSVRSLLACGHRISRISHGVRSRQLFARKFSGLGPHGGLTAADCKGFQTSSLSDLSAPFPVRPMGTSGNQSREEVHREDHKVDNALKNCRSSRPERQG